MNKINWSYSENSTKSTQCHYDYKTIKSRTLSLAPQKLKLNNKYSYIKKLNNLFDRNTWMYTFHRIL